MRRLARSTSQQGLLLVEAVLSAVVIAVGLVFISRALGGELRALRRLEETATLVRLAQAKLQELESMSWPSAGLAPIQPGEGTFDEPFTSYGWAITVKPFDYPESQHLPAHLITVTVRHRAGSGPAATLRAVWPLPGS